MLSPDRLPTRTTLLELREERQIMQEGYRFLDEKRLLLAAEILKQLTRYEEHMARFQVHQRQAAELLRAAVVRHGLEALSLYPSAPPAAPAEPRRYSFLGVQLLESADDTDPPLPETTPAEDPSPQARRCAEVFHRLLLQARDLALLSGNLHRLIDDYRRTERRARALEDVLLPETQEAIRDLEERLDDLDQEEAIRVRLKTGTKV
ncbi:MAG: V-type ATP synthase subunit D [Gammaproteobacteria bacterium]|nr:V-type ATP synthase subunit D [Gammaproteobacteria bacterium]